jgi:hypothetical protein
MGQPPAPSQGPDDIKKALAEARELAVRDEAERLAKSREDVPKAKEARLLPFAFIIAVAFGLYALAAQPTWLVTPPPPPESPRIVEASLRVAMWQQALHIERYRDEEGRLPVDLGQARAPTMDGVSYHQVGENSYLITGSNGATDLVLRSEESFQDFLGESIKTLANRGDS